MRVKTRIYKYFRLFLENIDCINDLSVKEFILSNKKNIFEEWRKYPDLRLPQLLFNFTGYSFFNSYYWIECEEFLNYIGVSEKETLIWGSLDGYYDYETSKLDGDFIYLLYLILFNGKFKEDVIKIPININGKFMITNIRKMYEFYFPNSAKGAYVELTDSNLKRFLTYVPKKYVFPKFNHSHFKYFMKAIYDSFEENLYLNIPSKFEKKVIKIFNDFYLDFEKTLFGYNLLFEDSIEEKCFLSYIFNCERLNEKRFSQFHSYFKYDYPNVLYRHLHLENIKSDHIEGILSSVTTIKPSYKKVFEAELQNRVFK